MQRYIEKEHFMIPAQAIQKMPKKGIRAPFKKGKEIIPEKKIITNKKDIVLFIVDDDPFYAKAIVRSVSNYLVNASIYVFHTGEACLQQMGRRPDFVILDYYLDSQIGYAWDGMKILRQIKKINPATKVIMLSAQDSLTLATKCLQNGAYEYVSKTGAALTRLNAILDTVLETEDVKGGDRTWQVVALIITFIILILILLNH